MDSLYDRLDHKEELYVWIQSYGGFENLTYWPRQKADLENLMRFWESAKSEYLYSMFGERFIVEKDVVIEEESGSISSKLYTSLVGGEMKTFCKDFEDWVINEMDYGRFTKEECDNLLMLVQCSNLGENRYNGKTLKLVINGTPITVQHGCKPIRTLCKIADAAELVGFERFRIAHSNILSDKIRQGTLCLSIHPLDYLTMSNSGYKWDTCLAWEKGGDQPRPGEHRVGTIEMMDSPCVVVAYLKGSEHLNYSGCEWNSKKWRNLFIVDKNFITGIKGYPVQDAALDKLCIEMLRELAEKNLGWTYCSDIIEHRFDRLEHNVVHIDQLNRDITFNFTTHLMYTDFGHNTTAHMIVASKIPDHVDCCYSGLAVCMYCGDVLINGVNYDSNDCSSVTCEECIPLLRCEECGEVIAPSEDIFELDGNMVCAECFETYAEYDFFDDSWHYRDKMKKVYLIAEKYIAKRPDFTREELLDSYYDFMETFPYAYVYNSLNVEVPIQTHILPPSPYGWWGSAHIQYIDLDKIKDDRIRDFIEQGFADNGILNQTW